MIDILKDSMPRLRLNKAIPATLGAAFLITLLAVQPVSMQSSK